MELMEHKKYYRKEGIKKAVYCLCMLFAVVPVIFWYQEQVRGFNDELSVLDKKSRLITSLHQQMLTVSRLQFYLLHASDYQQAYDLLLSMSENVSNYVVDFYQFEKIAGAEDKELVDKFRSGFMEWRSMTDDLSDYAYLVSNTDLINVLSIMELNLHRLDNDSAVLIIAKNYQ